MTQRRGLGVVPMGRPEHKSPRTPPAAGMFEQQFLQHLMAAFLPQIKELIREAMADEAAPPLIVDYEEAGRMIGTTYEGVRKLVRRGKLKAVSRSGRYRGIAVSELKEYVQRSQLLSGWGAFSAGR